MKPYSPQLQFGFLLSETARITRRVIDKRARSIGLSRAQWVVLSRISRNEGQRQVDLAVDMEMEPISIARHIDKLEQAGLVERRADPADRRAYRLYLLPAAAPVLEQVRAVAQSVLEPALAHLTPETLETLTRALDELRAQLLASENAGTENAGQNTTDSAA